MENNEEIVLEETENVEGQTTEENVNESTEEEVAENKTTEEQVEEPVKEEVRTYTDEEVNEIASKRAARVEKKLRREYERKYSKLGSVLNAGLGTSNLEDATSKLENFYKEKGIDIPNNYEPNMSDDDIEVLANSDADEIISLGYDEIKSEGERLANLGNNMSHREKKVLERLTSKMKEMEEEKELSTLGIAKEQLDDDFREFEKKLNPNLSLKEKYEMYASTKPKKEFKQIGSMKSGASNNDGLKDFYTRDEALRFTEEDYNKNPRLEEIIERSMLKW